MVNLILDAGGLNITSIKALVSTCLIEVEFDMEEWNSSSYSSLRVPRILRTFLILGYTNVWARDFLRWIEIYSSLVERKRERYRCAYGLYQSVGPTTEITWGD